MSLSESSPAAPDAARSGSLPALDAGAVALEEEALDTLDAAAVPLLDALAWGGG